MYPHYNSHVSDLLHIHSESHLFFTLQVPYDLFVANDHHIIFNLVPATLLSLSLLFISLTPTRPLQQTHL